MASFSAPPSLPLSNQSGNFRRRVRVRMQTAVLGGGPQSTVHRRRFVIAKIRYSQRLVWRVVDFCRSSPMIGKGGEAFVPSFLRSFVRPSFIPFHFESIAHKRMNRFARETPIRQTEKIQSNFREEKSFSRRNNGEERWTHAERRESSLWEEEEERRLRHMCEHILFALKRGRERFSLFLHLTTWQHLS